MIQDMWTYTCTLGKIFFYSNLDPAEHMLSLKNTLLNNSLLIKLRTSNKLETIQPPARGPTYIF